jgi:hypothetical protein
VIGDGCVAAWPGAEIVSVATAVLASDKTLEMMEDASVTGQMVVERTIVSVTSTVDTTPVPRDAMASVFVAAGQLITVGAQEITVRTEVVSIVKVVSASAVAVLVTPVSSKPPVGATV